MNSCKNPLLNKRFPRAVEKAKKVTVITVGVFLFLIILFPAVTEAQMFSVEEPERRSRTSAYALIIGPDFMTMKPRNGERANGEFYNFSDPVYRIRLDLPGVEVYAGLNSRIGAADTLNYLNLGANISGSLPLAGNRKIGIGLPLWLSTDYARVRSTDAQQPEADQFRQSSASVGLGAGAFYNPKQNIRVRAEFVPQIGFTVSSIGSDSGQLTSLNGRVRMNIDHLLGRFGLVAAYNYTWRRYSGSDDRFLYDLSGHHIALGVSF